MVIHVDEHWWWWILLSSRRRRDLPGFALLLPGRYFTAFSMTGTLPGRYFAIAQYDSSQSADTSLRSVWQEHYPADTSLSLSMTQQSISRYFAIAQYDTAVNQQILHCVQYDTAVNRQILHCVQYDSSQSADTSQRSVWQLYFII